MTLYLAHVGAEAIFFLLLAAPSAVSLWPWLSRHGVVDLVRLVFNLVTFTTLMLSWNYVKNSNRAAARAIQEKIDARTKPMSA